MLYFQCEFNAGNLICRDTASITFYGLLHPHCSFDKTKNTQQYCEVTTTLKFLKVWTFSIYQPCRFWILRWSWFYVLLYILTRGLSIVLQNDRKCISNTFINFIPSLRYSAHQRIFVCIRFQLSIISSKRRICERQNAWFQSYLIPSWENNFKASIKFD